MGLAAALKRQLGSGNGHQANGKRSRTAPAAPAALPLLPPANGGLPATRSARRQHNRAQRMQAEQLQEQKVDAEQGVNESDGEEEAAKSPLAADASAVAADPGPATAAYQALLASLKNSNAEFAAQLRERELEEAGLEDEDSEGEESEEGGGEEELGFDDDDEQEPAGAGSGDDDANASDDKRLHDGGEEAASEQAEEEEDKQVTEDGTPSEDEDGEGGSSDDERHLHEQQPSGAAGNECAGVMGAVAAQEDHYVRHFDHELTEAEAVALQAGAAGAGAPRAFVPRPEAPRALLQWESVELQATAGVGELPSAPSQLAAYGVKDRLAARWREAALDPAQQQQQQEANGQGSSRQQQRQAGGAGCKDRARGDFASPRQRALFALLSSYSDLLLPCRPYPTEANAPDPELDAVLLHLLSHCAKVRPAAAAGWTLGSGAEQTPPTNVLRPATDPPGGRPHQAQQ